MLVAEVLCAERQLRREREEQASSAISESARRACGVQCDPAERREKHGHDPQVVENEDARRVQNDAR